MKSEQKIKGIRVSVDRRLDGDVAGGLRVWMRVTVACGGEEVIVDHLLLEDEWADLIAGRRRVFADGYHRLDIDGDIWSLYDLPGAFSGGEAGVSSAAWVRLTMPPSVVELVAGVVAHAAARWDASDEPVLWRRSAVVVDLLSHLERWEAEGHGRGRGQAVYEGDAIAIEAAMARRQVDPGLDVCLERLERIATARTLHATETAPVRLYRDGEGYGFSAGGLAGGVINHGTDEEPDWSIHT